MSSHYGRLNNFNFPLVGKINFFGRLGHGRLHIKLNLLRSRSGRRRRHRRMPNQTWLHWRGGRD